MKRILFTLLFLGGLSSFLQAQEIDTLKQYLRSPYATVVTHLKYLQPESYQPELSALVIENADKKRAKELAVELKQVLDGRGLYVDVEGMPRIPNYIDSSTLLARYYLFPTIPEIYLEKRGGYWYYSEQTVRAIPKLHADVYPFGSDFLMNLFPKYGQKELWGLFVWQYVGLFLLILSAIVFHRLLTIFLKFVIDRLTDRFGHFQGNKDVVLAIAKPVSLFIISLLVLWLIPILQFPITINKYFIIALDIATPIFLIVAAVKVIDLISNYFERLALSTESTLDDQLIPLVRKALKIFVVLVGVLYILQSLQFNITALLAGVSIGGLAFALAAQDTIKNLFGSLMIFIDRPFQIGDWINFDGVDGTVEEVGFRSTRVRTFHNSVVSVPNGRVADMTVDNYGLRVFRRYKTVLTITYDTPPILIEKFVEGLQELVKNHPETRKDYFEIHLNDLGSHSINILFYIFFNVPSWSDELKARHIIVLEVLKLADTLGIQFAFPTQTIHVENLPGQNSLSPKYESDIEKIDAKVAAFMKEYRSRYAEAKK